MEMRESYLYSIGHGTRKADEFLNYLTRYNIEFLLDVRTTPFSRFNPQYNQKALKQFLEENAIRYVYMGDTLGGRPKDPDCYNEHGKINYEVLKNKDYFLKGIDRLKTAYNKNVPAAIMCSERKPEDCHRSLLIGKVLLRDQVVLKHIDETGSVRNQLDLERGLNLI